METLLQDLRYGFRMMRRSPGFTLIAVCALAIGIGANTAIFTVIHATLLRGLPFPESDKLVEISMTKHGVVNGMEASFPNFLDWRDQAKSFSGMSGFGTRILPVPQRTGMKLVPTTVVTGDFFNVLGVQPAVGRFFQTREESVDANPIVITYSFWQREFGGARQAIGQKLVVKDVSYTVIGVLPPGFQFARNPQAELYVLTPRSGPFFERRNLHWFHPVARLKPGVTVEQASAEMQAISARLSQQYPTTNAEMSTHIDPLNNLVVGPIRPVLIILMVTVGFVLLISCVNVANLLLARSVTRQREMAVRSALGAARSRVVRQLLTESMLLSLFGGVAGILFAFWGVELLLRAIPPTILAQMPYLDGLHINIPALLFTAAASIGSGVLFGIAPALHVSRDATNQALQESSGWGASSRNRLGLSMVGLELALSIVLLIGAGLMIKSFVRMLDVNPGFDTTHLLTTNAFLPEKYNDDKPNMEMQRNLQSRLKSLPGVVDVGTIDILPFTSSGNTVRLQAEGHAAVSAGEEPESLIRSVSPNYFSVIRANLLRGRYFSDADSPTAPHVVIMNRSLAKLLFNTDDVIGKRVRFTFNDKQPYMEIIGVVDDVKETSLDDGARPSIYTSLTQDTNIAYSFVVRTAGDPLALTRSVEDAIQSADRSIAVFQTFSIEQIIDGSYSTFLRQYPALLISIFGAIALLLATLGLYGIVSYSVSQRTREIGIRMALGAQRSNVIALFFRQGARVTAIGVVAGLIGAAIVARLISGMLFGISVLDPQTFLLAPLLLALMAVVAVIFPAWRASRVDPNIALRYE